MSSQSLTAQLLRMLAVLGVSLVIVHNSPALLDSLTRNAVNAGCHQHQDSMQPPASHMHHSGHH